MKDALRRRHPAMDTGMAGPWTCLEEWMGIDLLAWSAWASVGGYRRVGYEVKVSRSDLRRELLRPHKRSRQVAWCNEFYFAVPRGLLKPDELDYLEPEWEDGDFSRTPCPNSRSRENRAEWRLRCSRGTVQELMIGPLNMPAHWRHDSRYWPKESERRYVDVPCPGCCGLGYAERSRVEREAPTLWIPRDVGLVVVDGGGTRVLQKSPVRRDVPSLSPKEIGQLIRWTSMRPDPRHAGVGSPQTVPVPVDASDPAC